MTPVTPAAVVLGAGPAGSLAALALAEAGWRVTLAESAPFPRWKVCGACVGSLGVRTLAELGLQERFESLGPVRLRSTSLRWRSRTLRLGGGGIRVISRGALDVMLAEEAQQRGAEWHSETRGQIIDPGSASSRAVVRLRASEHTVEIEADAVIDARGLSAHAHDTQRTVARKSHIGLGATGPAPAWLPSGELAMLFGSSGYLGVVRTEDGCANWAAAVPPQLLREHASPGQAMAMLAEQAGVSPGPGTGTLESLRWKGTPLLSVWRPASAGRVLRVGDAAGYVEPLTGEGMSWAMLSAQHAAGLLCAGSAPATWRRQSRRLLAARRRRCFVVSRLARSPLALGAAFAAGRTLRTFGLEQWTLERAIGAEREAVRA